MTAPVTRRSIAGLLCVLLAACASPPPTPRAPLKLTVLHTNDHHGRFWPNSDGEYGLATRKTVIDAVRAEVAAAGGHTVLLDGGGVNTGVPESDLQDAEPDVRGICHWATTPWPWATTRSTSRPPCWPSSASGRRFPCCRPTSTAVRSAPSSPTASSMRGGYRIAVLGLTTFDTPRMVLPDNVRGLTFRKPADEAALLVPQLRQQADMVTTATHMGHDTNGQSGVNAPGGVAMARAVPGLDLIVGGHSQNPVCMLAEGCRNDAYLPGQPCAPDRQS